MYARIEDNKVVETGYRPTNPTYVLVEEPVYVYEDEYEEIPVVDDEGEPTGESTTVYLGQKQVQTDQTHVVPTTVSMPEFDGDIGPWEQFGWVEVVEQRARNEHDVPTDIVFERGKAVQKFYGPETLTVVDDKYQIVADGDDFTTVLWYPDTRYPVAKVTFTVNGHDFVVPLKDGRAEVEIDSDQPGAVEITAGAHSVTITAEA